MVSQLALTDLLLGLSDQAELAMVIQLIELCTEVTDNALNLLSFFIIKVGQYLLSIALGGAEALCRLVSFLLKLLHFLENFIEFCHALIHLCTHKIIGKASEHSVIELFHSL